MWWCLAIPDAGHAAAIAFPGDLSGKILIDVTNPNRVRFSRWPWEWNQLRR